MKNGLRIVNNSPLVVGFALLCFAAMILNMLTGGAANMALFSVYRSSLTNPLTYFRFIGHVFGHASWSHFFNNMITFVIIGPMLEEKYGEKNLISLMLTTAIVTGIVHFIFFPNSALLGASGIVFAFLILGSFAQSRSGEIPFTFILVSVVYIGDQIYQGLFVADDVSNLTHIIGGLIGAIYGFRLTKSGRY